MWAARKAPQSALLGKYFLSKRVGRQLWKIARLADRCYFDELQTVLQIRSHDHVDPRSLPIFIYQQFFQLSVKAWFSTVTDEAWVIYLTGAEPVSKQVDWIYVR